MRSFLRSRNEFIASIAVFIAVLMCCQMRHGSRAASTNDRSTLEEIKELRKKRVSIVTTIYEIMVDRYDAGRIPLDGVIDARIAVIQAKLDLSETGDDRLVVLNEMVR